MFLFMQGEQTVEMFWWIWGIFCFFLLLLFKQRNRSYLGLSKYRQWWSCQRPWKGSWRWDQDELNWLKCSLLPPVHAMDIVSSVIRHSIIQCSTKSWENLWYLEDPGQFICMKDVGELGLAVSNEVVQTTYSRFAAGVIYIRKQWSSTSQFREKNSE